MGGDGFRSMHSHYFMLVHHWRTVWQCAATISHIIHLPPFLTVLSLFSQAKLAPPPFLKPILLSLKVLRYTGHPYVTTLYQDPNSRLPCNRK